MIGRWIRQLALLRYMDWVMTLAVVLLLVIGVFFVYSSCYVSEELPVRSLYKRQMLWAVAGLVSYILFAAGDYRGLRRWSWWIYLAALALLVAVLFVGTEIYGARRWLMLFSVGIQPSELAKLAMIIMLARRFGRPGLYYDEVRSIRVTLLLAALPIVLVMAQPDLGTGLVFVPIVFLMLFCAGLPMRLFVVVGLLGVLAVGMVVGLLFVPEILWGPEAQERVFEITPLSAYQRSRILVFFNVDRDPLGAGWNKLQSQIAVGSGGLWGKGYLKGTQNILGFLPRSVAPTDFIYSVIAEEKGFMGSVVVLVLFACVLWGCVRAAVLARDKMGRLLCMGIVAMLFCHIVVNIAMTVGLMPITGLPLPLLSYGGSFMVVVLSALGMVQSVAIRARRVVL